MPAPLYLDYNATTPVAPAVLEAMLPYFSTHFGNPSSETHPFGWTAKEAVTLAREQLAALIGAEPRELIFTAGATEAINLALKGVAHAYRSKGNHLITVETEHKAVLDTCKALEREGFEVSYLPVGADGTLDPGVLADALRPETLLVAAMWANNETGVMHPLAELAALAHQHGALFMTDATQAIGKVPVDVAHVDLLACSAHKFYGPKGVGALYASRRQPRVRLMPVLDGGGQETGLRGGTLNTPGIVGLGAAAVLAQQHQATDTQRWTALRDRLEQRLLASLDGVRINGQAAERLPQTTNVSFAGVKAGSLIKHLRELAVSPGSACSSAATRPSHVLSAMGLTDEAAFASVRISLGRPTTEADVEQAADLLVRAVSTLRATTPAALAQ